MNEQSIFLAALDIADPAQRADYLNRTCDGDQALREEVDALLAAHQHSGEFLDVPVLKQMAGDFGGETSAEHHAAQGEIDLSFLQPSTAPGSIGRLGHYEVREVVGRGGCGIVLKAFDEKLERIVAIKVMAPELAATSPARKRFLREARATAAIRHENVVSIYAVEEQPLPFLVMEYIDGKTLQQRLDRTGPLDARDVLRIGHQVANGLAAAHDKGLIHRDIKPGNILLEDGTDHLKITDFGLARAADDASMTQSGVIAGTPLYMSPEQAQAQDIDHRSDLFSLGSVLYVMCSGRLPFRAATSIAVLRRVVEEQPRPIQGIIPEVPGWLVAIIAKLHAKNPAQRFASAREIGDLLARCLSELEKHGQVESLGDILPMLPQPASEAQESAQDEHLNSEAQADSALASLPARPQSRRWVAAAMILVLLAGLGMTEATGVTNVQGTIIRLFSSDGTLIVEVDDPGVSVTIDGEEMVISGAGAKEIRLKPGQYKVLASKDGKVVRQELVTVTTNGRQVVRVSREAAPATAMVGSSQSSVPAKSAAQRKALEWVLEDRDPRYRSHLTLSVKGNSVHLTTGDKLPDGQIEVLQISLSGIGKADSRTAIEMLTKLSCVDLRFHNSPGIGDEMLAALASDPGYAEVIHLWLNSTGVTERGLPYIAKFANLKTLGLGRAPASAKELAQFRGLPLTDLTMFVCKSVNDEAIAEATTIPTLKRLSLTELPLTDQSLEHLAKCKGLDSLSFARMKFSVASREKLAASLPQCKITWDGGVIEPSRYTNSLGMEFALVPKGKAWLSGASGKVGTTEVEFKEDFYLGVYEVTQHEWVKVMGNQPSFFSRGTWKPGRDAVKEVSDTDLKRFPVEMVTWNQVQEFLKALSQRETESGWVYRLPTAAEWEYACRGGPSFTKADSAFDFYLGKPSYDLPPELANFDNVLKRTCPVGSYKPNPLGLYDMHGNVHEWCDDLSDPDDPKSPRLLRGGSWQSDQWKCRAAFSFGRPAHYYFQDAGLRVARVRAN